MTPRTLLPLPLCCLLLLFATASSPLAIERRAEARLYVAVPASASMLKRLDTHALYEPPTGCYLGAYIDFDPTLQNQVRLNGCQPHQNPQMFEQETGKAHAMYFFYLGYGQKLPVPWIEFLARQGKFVHIALEPNNGMQQVHNNQYLRTLALQMRQTNAHIFLRFASEMNGTWTPYHPDPALYRKKFRLVYNVMHRLAPNVAMVWCPYFSPTANIAEYYPGKHHTDWVGVNIYNVPYHNNQIDDPGLHENPIDLLRFVYDHYAADHPLMICEFGVSHIAACEGQNRSQWAIRKMLDLYTALPRLFPRVKAINYFDSDNLIFVHNGVNDYSVADNPQILQAYHSAISSPWYLSGPITASQAPPVPVRMRNGITLQGIVHLSCIARAPSDRVSVVYRVDGTPIYSAFRADAWGCLWNAGSVGPGMHTLSLSVLGPGGREAAADSVRFRVP